MAVGESNFGGQTQVRSHQGLSGGHISVLLKISHQLLLLLLTQNREFLNLLHIGDQAVVADQRRQIRRCFQDQFRTGAHYFNQPLFNAYDKALYKHNLLHYKLGAKKNISIFRDKMQYLFIIF